MMNVQSLINGLEAWVQEELLARRKLLALLERQEEVVKRANGLDLEAVVHDIQVELDAQARRDEKRVRLFEGLAQHWGVSAETLTLTSIVERAGPQAARLALLRDELAAASERIVRKNRRLSALLSVHHKVVEELLCALVAIQGGTPGAPAGALVDAEA